ncbi:MAG: hypothetical protein M1816_002986 [Peltula sp. TS41687]|nr:MAG: hypothetical protein M1816_002986 [Peltula sp. TS41687]
MLHKAGRDSAMYSPRTTAARPLSDATEMFDTDFEEDAEDLDGSSPRASSINSTGKTSLTTVDSYDEAVTPISNHFASFDFQLNDKPVQGPRGPHLFRASQISSTSLDFHLSMSPLTPNEPKCRLETALRVHPASPVADNTSKTTNRPAGTIPHPYNGYADVRDWSPQQVAMWMYEAGFEESVVERFQSNDISGAILVDLKFEDLKELDIQSFGKRHRLWGEIQRLRGSPMNSPIEESPSFSDGNSPFFRSHQDDCLSPVGETAAEPRRHESRRTRRRRGSPADAVISPAESVSIVGIEQLIPKLHKCSKGENCSKYRRQQRQLALLAEEHPISPEQGGQLLITGDPGNAATAESMFRPVSEAVPSVVASSDILGPCQRPVIQLQEEALRIIQARDPQENVKQFLDFQHMRSATTPPELPSSPPDEMFPPLQAPLLSKSSVQDNLRSLAKLNIPLARANTVTSSTKTVVPPPRIDRFGTPSSAMDVPVTAVPLGPVARDFSQSVPPDMQYRRESPQSATNKSAGGAPHRRDSWQPSMRMARVDEDVQLEAVEGPDEPMIHGNDVNHSGWMKKRKTKFLRHEWHEHHFTLNGTNLAVRNDPRSSTVLENIDVDDYAVACSSLASSNKFSAAFKAMKLSSGKREADNAPFTFQLVPATEKKGVRQPVKAATGKTHHFATTNRSDRISWLRAVMVAKALKQKSEGYEVSINGKTMI